MFTIIVMLVLFGLASWIITTILVEGAIFDDVRNWVDIQQRKAEAKMVGLSYPPSKEDSKKAAEALAALRAGMTLDDVLGKPSTSSKLNAWFWNKMRYLVGCHLCTGTWVSMGLALFLPAIVSPAFFGWFINAFIVKAIGHLVLAANNLTNAKIDLMKSDTEASKKLADGKAAALTAALGDILKGGGTVMPSRQQGPRMTSFDDYGDHGFGGRF